MSVVRLPKRNLYLRWLNVTNYLVLLQNIAEIMKKSINSISTARAQLINKGIIYPVKYRELDFTVPQFSGFIHRLEEYKQWDTI